MRITVKHIENRLNYLNKITKNRVEKYLPYKVNNRLVANVGNYYLSQSNGGFRVEQIVNIFGGCADISFKGTKKEIYEWINTFINGIETVILKK
jgi:hypothetical protein